MTYTIEKVTTLIGARRYGDNDTNIGFILTDSRSLCFPEETLFFALKSERNDGHNYIPELYRRGVKNFVVTDVPKGYASDYPEANFLKVVNTLEALQRLAERHRDEFNIPIVGITGSNGKTMVKEWLYQLLSPKHVCYPQPAQLQLSDRCAIVGMADERADPGGRLRGGYQSAWRDACPA